MKRTRIISLLTVAVMLIAIALTLGLSALAKEDGDSGVAPGSRGTIDVWLIGGQSNAVGYGDNTPPEAETDYRYFTGFDNTLFYGVNEVFTYNKDYLSPVTLGLGQKPTRSGAEIGVAKALDSTGAMNAVIKCAVGATALYPDLNANISQSVGTWTSPSYIERANMDKNDPDYATLGTFVNINGEVQDIPDIDLSVKIAAGNADNNGNVMAGNMYNMFVKTVTEGIRQLKAEGYTPVVRGMWWMQGEAECSNDTKAYLYDELLTCLINDVRDFVAEVTDDATANSEDDPMPFLAGNIIWLASNAANAPKHIPTVNAAQAMVAEAMTNVAYLDKDITNAQSFFGQQDNWHYNVATQQFFGEQLVAYALSLDNESIVKADGDDGFTFVGGGTLKNGTSATVTFLAEENYKINGVTLNGAPITLDENGSYTFTVTANASFVVDTTYTASLPTTPYGEIGEDYVNAENYPFALFKNGAFVKGYAAWRTAMLAVPSSVSNDEYVVLLRRDYTTAGIDGAGAQRATITGVNLTVDLGGYNMTRSNVGYVFDIYHSSASVYPTNVTVKNGTITSATDDPVIGLNYSTSSAYANEKTYNFTFNEVTFVNAASTRKIPLITACWENGNENAYAGIHANIVLNGCTVDLGNIANGIVAGLTNDAKNTNTVGTLTVNGGNLIFGGSGYSLAASDTLDTVTVGSYNGSYPTVTLPTGVTPSGETYKDKDGVICGTVAGTGVVNGNTTVYTFSPNALVTPYGTIGEEFADANTYPFAIFNANGFVTATKTFKLAFDKAFNNMVNKESLIYLRRDYENIGSDDNINGFLSYINGTIKIDLNEHTLARKSGTLFDVYINGKSSSGYVSNVEVFNGTLAAHQDGPIIAMDYNGSSSSQIAGVVKQFNMTFTNVRFESTVAFSSGRALILDIWDNKKDVQYKTKCDFKFYGCTFDLENVNNSKHPFRANDRTNRSSSMDVSLYVYGGEFLNMENNWMFYGDAGDKMYVGKYDGSYPTIAIDAGKELLDKNSSFGATTNANDNIKIVQTASNSSGVYFRFALQEYTSYGKIPAGYDDTAKYPMAFFSYDKEAGTYTFLKVGTFATIREFYSTTEEKNIVAYLRADHVIDKNADPTCIKGSFTLDLGGHVLTRDTTHMFDVVAKNDYRDFVSNTVVKNGTILSKTSFAIGINNSSITGANKTWNLTFEGVTFEYAAGNTTNQGAFFNCWQSIKEKEEFGVIVSVSFNDCIYDFTNAPKNAFMFSLTGNDSTEETDVTAYFNGGKVIAPSMNINWQIFNVNTAQDSVYFGDDPIKVYVAEGGSQPTASNTVKTSDKTYSYIATGSEGGYKVYELEVFENSEDTPYGKITGLTSETVSKADYPVAIFTPNGDSWTYKGVYKTFQAALKEAAKVEGSVIVFRTNVTPSSTEKPYFITGTIIVDLNGYSYTKDTGVYLLDSYIGATVVNCNITFKNGTVKKGSTSNDMGLFCLNYHKAQTELSTFNMVFENVTLINEKGTDTFLFSMWEDGYATETTKGIVANVTFNNCEFDLGNAIAFTLDVAAGNNRDKTVLNVTVNGGKLVSNSALTLSKLVRKNNNDTFTLGNYNGSYPEFVYAKSMAYVLHGISVTENGENYTLAINRTEGDKVVYAFAPANATVYGDVPAEYDANAYPFALFKNGVGFIGAYSELGAAINAAVAKDNNGSFTILMRADGPQTAGGGIGGFKGSIVFDLGGYTIKDESNQYILDAWLWANSTEQTYGTFTFKNGSIAKYGTDALFCINYGNELYANAYYNITFENVKFTLYNKTNGLFVTWENGKGSATANQIANITFNNCIFDLANSEAGAVPFNLTMGDGTGTVFNVTVNGGKFITKGAVKYNDLVVKNDNEYVVFDKNVVFSMPSGATAPGNDNVWTIKDGVECVFVKTSEGDGYANYSFYPVVMAGYKIKTSVTLYSNFVYNIYIPVANVNGFTVNGMAMDYTTEVIDNVEYYVVKVDLAAGETLADIKLCVTLKSGDTTVDANWTLNVYNYTKAVLGGDYNETTKTLMKDMLVYASAAHTYFENTEAVADKLAEIKTLLGDYNAALPTGEAKAPTGTTYFEEIAVYLGEVPSFRFTLASGYTAADFTFKVGNRAVDVIASDDGKYVEIVMYAYMMLDDVTFTVKSTGETGTYNLYSYLDYAKNVVKDANLVAIVEALMKYSVAAGNYRNSVIGM